MLPHVFFKIVIATLTATTIALPLANGTVAAVEITNGTSSLEDDPASAGALLGLNCRGSAFCKGCGSMGAIKKAVDLIPDNMQYPSGHQVVCAACPITGPEAICLFSQKMGDKKLPASVFKEKVNRMIKHNCKNCGSCPTYPGNNVNDGEITVNYVQHGCGDGICPYPPQ